MQDHTYAVQRALYQLINRAGLSLDDEKVAVYAYAPPGSSAPYILIDQVSTTPATATAACQIWECVFQLTILTSFQLAGDDEPSFQIQEQILSLLQGQQLELDGELQAQQISVTLLRKSTEYDQKSVNVLRYIRLRVLVY